MPSRLSSSIQLVLWTSELLKIVDDINDVLQTIPPIDLFEHFGLMLKRIKKGIENDYVVDAVEEDSKMSEEPKTT